MKPTKKVYKEYINSAAWKNIREEMIWLYDGKCSKCGKDFELHVHHLNYKTFGNESVFDLTVLCQTCHMALHKKPKKSKKAIMKRRERRRSKRKGNKK